MRVVKHLIGLPRQVVEWSVESDALEGAHGRGVANRRPLTVSTNPSHAVVLCTE